MTALFQPLSWVRRFATAAALGRWASVLIAALAALSAEARAQTLSTAEQDRAAARLEALLGPARENLGVVVGEGRNRLVIGETTRISIGSRVPGRLFVLAVDADGVLALIHPSPIGAEMVQPGAPARLPALAVTPPAGAIRLIALVAPERVVWSGSVARALSAANAFEKIQAPAALLAELSDQIDASLAEDPAADWGLAVARIEVEAPDRPGLRDAAGNVSDWTADCQGGACPKGAERGGVWDEDASGQQTGRGANADCPIDGTDDLGVFADPAPTPTSQIQITHLELRAALRRFGVDDASEAPSLLAGASALQAALRRRGYTEQRVYRSAVGCGLVLATRLERIAEDGAPADGPDRFAVAAGDRFSVAEALMALFFVPEPGRWRIAVFSLATHPARTAPNAPASGAWAEDLLDRSAQVAPDAASEAPLDGRFKLQVLIYEFERARALGGDRGEAAEALLRQLTGAQSGLSVGQHLRASALGALVGGP